jgi:hypothetical protein
MVKETCSKSIMSNMFKDGNTALSLAEQVSFSTNTAMEFRDLHNYACGKKTPMKRCVKKVKSQGKSDQSAGAICATSVKGYSQDDCIESLVTLGLKKSEARQMCVSVAKRKMDAEPYISSWEDLEGGKADNKPDSKYDSDQVKKGIAVEREHVDDKDAQKEIAKDHLEEIPDYYDHLKKMEESAKTTHAIAENEVKKYAKEEDEEEDEEEGDEEDLTEDADVPANDESWGRKGNRVIHIEYEDKKEKDDKDDEESDEEEEEEKEDETRQTGKYSQRAKNVCQSSGKSAALCAWIGKKKGKIAAAGR